MSWTAPIPPEAGDEPTAGPIRPILQGYLDWQRSTLLNICAGLTADQLAERADPPSRRCGRSGRRVTSPLPICCGNRSTA